jgi:hypothetical protein
MLGLRHPDQGRPRLLVCDPLGGKHKPESGHLDSAVDTAAMPLEELPGSVRN